MENALALTSLFILSEPQSFTETLRIRASLSDSQERKSCGRVILERDPKQINWPR